MGIDSEKTNGTVIQLPGTVTNGVVVLGDGATVPPLSPVLSKAKVTVLDPNGATVATGSSATAGQTVTLLNVGPLNSGDTVEVEIEGIGVLRNVVR